MQPASFRESDAMLVDDNDGPAAFKPQGYRHSVKKGFAKPVRGLMPSNRNPQMGNIVLDSRPPTPSPNLFNTASYSRVSPTPKMLSPSPNHPQNNMVFSPKRKPTVIFKGALERVISLTRKRQRVGDDLNDQIIDTTSTQYGSSEESSATLPQPPQKAPRRGAIWPSSLLFAPPGLERRTVVQPAISPIPNPPPYAVPHPSVVNHGLHPATPRLESPRPDDHKAFDPFGISRLTNVRPSAATPTRPPKRHLSTLKDFFLPRAFGAHGMRDFDSILAPDEMVTRCESPEPISQPYHGSSSGLGLNVGYTAGGDGLDTTTTTHPYGGYRDLRGPRYNGY